jgi:acetyltransferase-like isoleucine patch superfamily enzyme
MTLVGSPAELAALQAGGWLVLGEGARVEAGVDLCHPTRDGTRRPVVLGAGCLVRSGTVLYSGVRLGERCQTGHHAVVREDAEVGPGSVLGTGVTVEFGALVGARVLVETGAHLTAGIVVEDDVFVGPGCLTANDQRMLHRRAGARERLAGPRLCRGARLGAGAVVLPGVVVGRDAVVAAGAVVGRDVPERTLVAGNPARLLGPVPDGEALLEP